MATVFKRGPNKNHKGARWVVCWFDAERGEWRNRTAYTDKESSVELGRRLEREAARRTEGLTDPMDAHRRRPIDQHLTDFIAKVNAGQRDARYAQQLENRIRRIIDGTKIERLHELDAVRVERFLSELRVQNS